MLTICSRPWLDCFLFFFSFSLFLIFLNLFIFFFFCCCIQTIEKMSPVIFTLSPDPLIKRASFLSFDVLLDFFFVRFFFYYSFSNLRLFYSLLLWVALFSFHSKRTEEERSLAASFGPIVQEFLFCFSRRR